MYSALYIVPSLCFLGHLALLELFLWCLSFGPQVFLRPQLPFLPSHSSFLWLRLYPQHPCLLFTRHFLLLGTLLPGASIQLIPGPALFLVAILLPLHSEPVLWSLGGRKILTLYKFNQLPFFLMIYFKCMDVVICMHVCTVFVQWL